MNQSRPPLQLLNDNDWMSVDAVPTLLLLVVLGIATVIVVWHAFRQQRRFRQTVVNWGDVADKMGFEFSEMGFQDMTIQGQSSGGLSVRVESEEGLQTGLLREHGPLSTRVTVRHPRNAPVKELFMTTRGNRRQRRELSTADEEPALRELYECTDATSKHPSEITDGILRAVLKELAEKSDTVVVSGDRVVCERDELVMEPPELRAMIEDGLKLSGLLTEN